MNSVTHVLSTIGFEESDHLSFLSALILRGIFTDAEPLQNRFERSHRQLEEVRESFKEILDTTIEYDFDELMNVAHQLRKILSNKFTGEEFANFILGVTQDYTIKVGGFSNTVNNNFADRSFGESSKPFTSLEKIIFKSFQKDSLPLDIIEFPSSSHIAILGTAGKNFEERVEGLLSLLCRCKEKQSIYYTSNARYFLKCENHLASEVLDFWFSKSYGRSYQDARYEVRRAIKEILEKEGDFTKNDNYHDLPRYIHLKVDPILRKHGLEVVETWPGYKYSILIRNESLYESFEKCEEIQNDVRSKRLDIDPDLPKITRRSTPMMPTPFDYIQMCLEQSFYWYDSYEKEVIDISDSVVFVPHGMVFKPIVKDISGHKDIPDILLCNTEDEVKSYKDRNIPLSMVISDSDNFIQQRKTVQDLNPVDTFAYAVMPDDCYANFVMSLSKSLYGPLNAYIKAN